MQQNWGREASQELAEPGGTGTSSTASTGSPRASGQTAANLVSSQRFIQVETIQGINDLIIYPPSVPLAIPLSGGQWRGTCQSIPHDLVIVKVAKVNSSVALFFLFQILRSSIPLVAGPKATALARLALTFAEMLRRLSGGTKAYSIMASLEWSEDNLHNARLPSARSVS